MWPITSKKQPERPPADFTFDQVETFIGGFLVHTQRHSNVRCFTKGRVLCCVMAFTEMIHTITAGALGSVNAEREETSAWLTSNG
jgi:hypothetical protein